MYRPVSVETEAAGAGDHSRATAERGSRMADKADVQSLERAAALSYQTDLVKEQLTFLLATCDLATDSGKAKASRKGKCPDSRRSSSECPSGWKAFRSSCEINPSFFDCSGPEKPRRNRPVGTPGEFLRRLTIR